jgi:hypothetical protein
MFIYMHVRCTTYMSVCRLGIHCYQQREVIVTLSRALVATQWLLEIGPSFFAAQYNPAYQKDTRIKYTTRSMHGRDDGNERLVRMEY